MPVPEACDSAEQRGRMSSADDPGQRESSSSSTRTSAVPSKPKVTTSIQAAAQQTYDGLSFSKFMIAGSLAGMAEHIAMFPVDTIKTRMQAISTPGSQVSSTILRAMSSVIRAEGIAGLYRGVAAVAIGAGPSHGIYFAVYEYMKILLGANDGGHRPLETSVAAIAATCVGDAVMTPLDVVKQRLQLANTPYKGILDCVATTLRKEGMRAFFKSYNTTIFMNIPFVSIHFASYESCKKMLRKSPEDEGLMTQVVAGGIAGGAAAAATNPLDVVKTRLQTEGVVSEATQYKTSSSSSFSVLRNIIQSEGYGALMHGMRPRIMFHAPAAAISWMTYETCKKFLSV